MPSTRRSVKTPQRTSSQRNSNTTPKVANPVCKLSKAGKLISNKSVFPDASKTNKPTEEIMSAVQKRRQKSEISDIKTHIPVKRSKRYSEETQLKSLKHNTVSDAKTKTNSSFKQSCKTDYKSKISRNTDPTDLIPENKQVSCNKTFNVTQTKRKSLELPVLKSSSKHISVEPVTKKLKEQSSLVGPAVSTVDPPASTVDPPANTVDPPYITVDPPAMCKRKRGRPTKEECLAAKISNKTAEIRTSLNHPKQTLGAGNIGSSDVKAEDSKVNRNSSSEDFSPRRSGRAMVPNRRYQDIDDPTDRKTTNTPKAKKGTATTKMLQKEQKTSPSISNKSHIQKMENVESEFVLTTKDGQTHKMCKENIICTSIPESTKTIGDSESNEKVKHVVLDKKTTGRVRTFSKNETGDKKKDNNIPVGSLHFKNASDVVSHEKTLATNNSEKQDCYSSSESKVLVSPTSSCGKIVDTKTLPKIQNETKVEKSVIQSTKKVNEGSDSSVASGRSLQDIEHSKENKRSMSEKVSESKKSKSQTSVVSDKEPEDSNVVNLIDSGGSASFSTTKVPVSTSAYSVEKKSQKINLNIPDCPDKDTDPTENRSKNESETAASDDPAESHSKDVKSSRSPRAETTKKPLIHARGSSASKPPPEVQTQTIYTVNLDGTSTRTVIILEPDKSPSKGRSLLKSSTELQKKEKESPGNNEPKGSQSDQVSSGKKSDILASVINEMMVKGNKTIQLVENPCKLFSTDGDHTSPGKIQKAAMKAKHNIPEISNENLPPFIKVVSLPCKEDITESLEITSDVEIQIEEENASEEPDSRVLKMDARTKRAVASILSLESGITFTSPPSTQETIKNSSCQENQSIAMANTEESVVLHPSESSSNAESLTIESLTEENNKIVSSEVSKQSITTEASMKNITNSSQSTYVVEVDNPDCSTSSELNVLWSDILEANSVTSGQTADVDENKSKYVTSSTQTPIESADEKIIIPKVYKSVIDVSHIKKEIEYEEGIDERNKETLVVVKLPEGAIVTQPVVQSRYKYDDTPFLDENYLDIFRCKICHYETNKKANWYKHKQKHLGLRPHACDQCQYRAATASNLKRHLAIHADIRNFMCQICGMYFRQKIHLERHIKYKHEEKQVRCPLCDYICANENPDLKVHIKRKHFSGELMESSLKAFTCPECSLIALSKKDLRQHMKFHKVGPELKLFCEHCSFVTDCDSRLRRHMFIHTKEKPYQCGMCEYRASQKEHVLRHMRNVHDIEIHRNRRKPQTGNQLVEGGQISMAALSKLIDRNDYTCRDKIFACNHCSMKFSKLLNLYKHLYTQHENIMPPQKEDEFGCVVCEFQTNTKKNLLVHMRKHNMHDHNPPSHVYSCVLCRYRNPKRRNLFQHMKKKHHIEIVMKEDGTTSCFIEDSSSLPEDLDQNLMTVGDIVTTTTSHFDSDGDETEYRNVISIQNFASMVAPQPTAINEGEGNLVIDTEISNQDVQMSNIDAAEAIEGLQALSQQTRLSGVVEIMEAEEQTVTVLDEPTAMKTADGMEELETSQEEKQSIQLSADQLVNLSSGDYVEINGEVYKVEIADSKQHGIAAEHIELEEVSCVD